MIEALNHHSALQGKAERSDRIMIRDDAGHGGSDGLHGYVESLDQVVLDTVSAPEQ